MKVYVVTSGDEEYMAIEDVASTAERGWALAAEVHGGDVQVWDVDEDETVLVSVAFEIVMGRRGECRSVRAFVPEPEWEPSDKIGRWGYRSKAISLRCSCRAKTFEQAKEIANEKRVALLADNNWTID